MPTKPPKSRPAAADSRNSAGQAPQPGRKAHRTFRVDVPFRPLTDLAPYVRNSRKHTTAQVMQVVASIDEFGYTNPVLADRKGIVAGHARVLAAQIIYDAGRTIRLPDGREIPKGTIPTLDCTGWSDAKRRAYVIADNKLALLSEWDEDMLRVEFEELDNDGFDSLLTGFSITELETLALGADIDGDLSTERRYSRKILAPVYEPKGPCPPVPALLDTSRADALLQQIDAEPGLPADVRSFLRQAAQRHTVFHFGRIAEFYAHAPANIQRMMESSALVIIDFDQAIAAGFVRLSQNIADQYAEDQSEEIEDDDA